MSSKNRYYLFEGSEAEYISFLENKVAEYESIIYLSQLGPSNPRHVSQESTGNGEVTLNERAQAVPIDSSYPPLQPDARELVYGTSASVPRPAKRRLDDPFIQFDPSTVVARQSKRQEKPRWQREVDKLLDDIPELVDWDDRRRDKNLASVEDNQRAVKTFLNPSFGITLDRDEQSGSDKLVPSTDSLVQSAYNYAHLTKDFVDRSECALMLSRFQEIILVSLCTVLVSLGVAADRVNYVMRIGGVSDSGDKNLERLRSGSVWVNRCIAQLSTRGWGDRSSEIFLLCGRQIHQYGRLADFGAESCTYFTNHLARRKGTDSICEIPGWKPFSIPCIIKRLVPEHISLHDICSFLKYDPESVKTIYEEFFITDEEKAARVGATDDDTECIYGSHNREDSEPHRSQEDSSRESHIPSNTESFDEITLRDLEGLNKSSGRNHNNRANLSPSTRVYMNWNSPPPSTRVFMNWNDPVLTDTAQFDGEGLEF